MRKVRIYTFGNRSSAFVFTLFFVLFFILMVFFILVGFFSLLVLGSVAFIYMFFKSLFFGSKKGLKDEREDQVYTLKKNDYEIKRKDF